MIPPMIDVGTPYTPFLQHFPHSSSSPSPPSISPSSPPNSISSIPIPLQVPHVPLYALLHCVCMTRRSTISLKVVKVVSACCVLQLRAIDA
eukprot:g48327.t1